MSEKEEVDDKILSLQNEITKIDQDVSDIEVKLNKYKTKIATLKSNRNLLFEQLQKLQRAKNQSNEEWNKNDFDWSVKINSLLKDRFHLNSFRALQKETINVTLSKRDCMLIMPTGGGKSLCFQLPALYEETGFTIVVSPLVSLIEDQKMALDELNINAALLSASRPSKEVLKDMISPKSQMKILYVTPEKLAKSKLFMSKLQKAYEANLLNRVVIDEVHCISHWGHDFRPDYKILGILKRQFPNTPILGLTATASSRILDDVLDILQLDHTCVLFRASFNRPNLFYEVKHSSEDQKTQVKEIATRIKQEFNGMSGIVYCFSRKESEEVAIQLREHGIKSHFYHADMDAETKSKVHVAWSKNKLQVVVATVAFGMGIDKPNVRFVIHFSMSKSIENYYQESGRAGRDDQPSSCILYFRFKDIFRQSSMVFTEKTGLKNLYNMVKYCLDNSKCRRNIISKYFDEDWSSSHCNEMCDNCKQEQAVSTRESRDLRADAESHIEILSTTTQTNERITPLKLISIWKGGGKVIQRPTRLTNLRQEHCERIISKLLVEDILREDFHFTPYSTFSYLIPGSRWPLLEAKKIHVSIDILKNSGVQSTNVTEVTSSKVTTLSKKSRDLKNEELHKAPARKKSRLCSSDKVTSIDISSDDDFVD